MIVGSHVIYMLYIAYINKGGSHDRFLFIVAIGSPETKLLSISFLHFCNFLVNFLGNMTDLTMKASGDTAHLSIIRYALLYYISTSKPH